jgi:hypothetical protein
MLKHRLKDDRRDNFKEPKSQTDDSLMRIEEAKKDLIFALRNAEKSKHKMLLLG